MKSETLTIDVNDVLSDEEIQTLIMRFAQTRGDECFTEEDLVKVVDWASEIRVGERVLSLLLKGLLGVDISHDGNVVVTARNNNTEELQA